MYTVQSHCTVWVIKLWNRRTTFFSKFMISNSPKPLSCISEPLWFHCDYDENRLDIFYYIVFIRYVSKTQRIQNDRSKMIHKSILNWILYSRLEELLHWAIISFNIFIFFVNFPAFEFHLFRAYGWGIKGKMAKKCVTRFKWL